MYSVVLMAAMTTGTATPDWGWRANGCHGCYGGCNGCYGGVGWRRSYGCAGCYGGCYGGCHGYVAGSWGCYGCYGYGHTMWSCNGGCYGSISPYHVMPGAPGDKPAEKIPLPEEKKKKSDDKKQETSTVRATLVIDVPADAKLYIDDQPMKSSSTRRTFQTPPLQPGQLYYYMVRVEVERDGQTKSETRRVIIRPGEQARASFPALEPPGIATAGPE